LAVAAAVVAHEPEVLRERRDLVVPHMQRGAERIRQHQYRGVVRTLDLGMDDATVVGFDIGHFLLLRRRTLISPNCPRQPFSRHNALSMGRARR